MKRIMLIIFIVLLVFVTGCRKPKTTKTTTQKPWRTTEYKTLATTEEGFVAESPTATLPRD